MEDSHKHKNAWVVSVNMGYGHERAAYGVKNLAHGNIITANDYPGIPDRDRTLWRDTRRLYEIVSRMQPLPFIGEEMFELMDYIQRIQPFYPRRDLSRPTIQVRQTYYLIEKLGLGRHLIEKLSKNPLPLVTTFFLPAFAAEVYNYPGDIYLIICDADVSRAWVPRDPKQSRIKYFASNGRTVERLKLYGIREENIFLTGFPLPMELVGGADATVLKKDLKARLCNLDPNGIFLNKYIKTLEVYLGVGECELKKNHPLTLSFTVGGAGAQRQIGEQIIKSLKPRIQRDQLTLHLVAGTNKDVADDFLDNIKDAGLKKYLNENIFVDVYPNRATYFREFTKSLHKTDILWTKPSEMSFYTGLGLPIIMAPSIGSQEVFNRTWLKTVGGGVTQGDPRYANEWLFDWLESGGLARIAWNGYIEAPTHGAYRIENIVANEKMVLEKLPLIV